MFPESRAVYEKMWENMVQPDTPQMTNSAPKRRVLHAQ